MNKLKKDKLLKSILAAANSAQTTFVMFGITGVVMLLIDCEMMGYACMGAFSYFAWMRLGLERQYLELESRDEEP